MDVTKKCVISGKHGFDLSKRNRFVILELEAKNGDLIKVNKVNGLKYNELLAVFEYPSHEEHPILDNENKIIILGGEENQSKRTICVIGK